MTKVKPDNGFIAFASETKNFETLEDQVLGEYLKKLRITILGQKQLVLTILKVGRNVMLTLLQA